MPVFPAPSYREQALERFKVEFPRVSVKAICAVQRHYDFHFRAAFYQLQRIENVRLGEMGDLPAFLESVDPVFIKNDRRVKKRVVINDTNLLEAMGNIPELQKKAPAHKNKQHNTENDKDKENQDANNFIEQNATTGTQETHDTDVPPPDIPLFVCECCFDDEITMDILVQCNEGHLFCMPCVEHTVNEQVFGKNCARIHCMSDEGCLSGFPVSTLDQLPEKTKIALTTMEAREAVEAANLDGMIPCPTCACSFQCHPKSMEYIAQGRAIALLCPNRACKHAFCGSCRNAPHGKLSCEQAREEQDRTNATNGAAEAMTAAVVRTCPNPTCGLPFFKEEGCNKMTCPTCKTKSCYLCRAQLDTLPDPYKHFCRTFECNHKKCGKCVLFTDSIEDDRMARRQAAEASFQQAQGETEAAAVQLLLSPQDKDDPPEPRPEAPLPRVLPIDDQHLNDPAALPPPIEREVPQRPAAHGRDLHRAPPAAPVQEEQQGPPHQPPVQADPPHQPPVQAGPPHQPPVQAGPPHQPPVQTGPPHQPPVQAGPPQRIDPTIPPVVPEAPRRLRNANANARRCCIM